MTESPIKGWTTFEFAKICDTWNAVEDKIRALFDDGVMFNEPADTECVYHPDEDTMLGILRWWLKDGFLFVTVTEYDCNGDVYGPGSACYGGPQTYCCPEAWLAMPKDQYMQEFKARYTPYDPHKEDREQSEYAEYLRLREKFEK